MIFIIEDSPPKCRQGARQFAFKESPAKDSMAEMISWRRFSPKILFSKEKPFGEFLEPAVKSLAPTPDLSPARTIYQTARCVVGCASNQRQIY